MFNFESSWQAAENLYNDGKRAESRDLLSHIAAQPVEADNPDDIRCKELAVYRLAEILCLEKQPNALVELLKTIRPFFSVLPKAKTTKIVRKIFDHIFSAGATLDEQLNVCHDMISWARQEKRTFLRHRLQHRLAQVLFEKRDARESLQTINALLKEVRRLDDRSLLVDIHLLESKVYHSIKNLSKARAALVSARTNANAIYCPPLAQAEIDLQSGILHAEEKDPKTAFSYLFEAFEGLHTLGDHARQARVALRYMILAKIATDQQDELAQTLSAKNVLEYTGRDTDALRGIAAAYKNQDTHAFNTVLTDYADIFNDDDIVRRQLLDMYDALLEKHLIKIVAPYSRVQIAYIADLLKLPHDVVEARVSQMILDKKLHGIVDQQQSCFVVFEDLEKKATAATLYTNVLDTIENLDKLVTTLFDKVAGKFDKLVEAQLEKQKQEKQKKKKNDEKDGAEDEKKKGAADAPAADKQAGDSKKK